jgi:hypothetical protein
LRELGIREARNKGTLPQKGRCRELREAMIEIAGHQGSKNTGNLASCSISWIRRYCRGGQQEAKNMRELDHIGKLRKETWSLSGIHGSKKHQRRKG